MSNPRNRQQKAPPGGPVLHAALENWLIGLVRTGQPAGCQGALLLLFWSGDRAEIVAALAQEIDDLPGKLRRMAEEVERGGGQPLGRHMQSFKGNTMKKTFVCKLPNGKFVGNLISSPGRSFVEVDRKFACEFNTAEDAKNLAAEHGAKGFTVMAKWW